MQLQPEVAEHAIGLADDFFFVDEALQVLDDGEEANPDCFLCWDTTLSAFARIVHVDRYGLP